MALLLNLASRALLLDQKSLAKLVAYYYYSRRRDSGNCRGTPDRPLVDIFNYPLVELVFVLSAKSSAMVVSQWLVVVVRQQERSDNSK